MNDLTTHINKKRLANKNTWVCGVAKGIRSDGSEAIIQYKTFNCFVKSFMIEREEITPRMCMCPMEFKRFFDKKLNQFTEFKIY